MIELTTTLFIFLTALHSGITITNVPAVAEASVKTEMSTESDTTPMNLEMYVREYFKDTPVLAEISKCESTFKHYDKNGNVIRGIVDSRDVGVMQINEHYHSEEAKKLGLDLTTVEGNLAYAKHLYEKEGVDPWTPSAKCWKKTQAGGAALAQK